jgi:hypothetical protein
MSPSVGTTSLGSPLPMFRIGAMDQPPTIFPTTPCWLLYHRGWPIAGLRRVTGVTHPDNLGNSVSDKDAGSQDHWLRYPRSRPSNLQFHLVFFPTAHPFFCKEVSVIAEIVRAAGSVSRFVNLHPYPSLSRRDLRSTIAAFVWVADRHVSYL